MVQQAKIEKFFGDRYVFYSKGTYDEKGEYLGRIWDNELDHWVPEQFQRRKPKVQVTSGIKYDKKCGLRMTDGKRKPLLVSRLIYQAFHPEWDMFKDPYHEHINHINEDETCNNDLDNLELMTPEQNIHYGTCIQRRAESCRFQRRTSTSCKRSKAVVKIESGEFYWSQKIAGESFGKGRGGGGSIGMCCRGLQEMAYGYHWRYAEESEIFEHS